MRNFRTLLTVTALVAAGQTVQAQSSLASGETTANMTIADINTLRFDNSVSLNILTGAAGSALTTVTASSLYDIISNASGSKLTAVIDEDMPEGSSLSVTLAAPSGATSAGKQTLTSSAVDVVTEISNVSQTGLSMTYTFGADVNTPKSLERTVTYVLTAGA